MRCGKSRLIGGLSDGLVATLTRNIEADVNDFSSRNKLRLLQIVRVMPDANYTAQLAINMATMDVCDKLLFAILGGPGKPRASLGHLVHPTQPPITMCQFRLYDLLMNFTDVPHGEAGASWLIFKWLCGKFHEATHRLEARRSILQISAAMTDYFELRMAKAPYRLFGILHEVVPQRDKLRVV